MPTTGNNIVDPKARGGQGIHLSNVSGVALPTAGIRKSSRIKGLIYTPNLTESE